MVAITDREYSRIFERNDISNPWEKDEFSKYEKGIQEFDCKDNSSKKRGEALEEATIAISKADFTLGNCSKNQVEKIKEASFEIEKKIKKTSSKLNDPDYKRLKKYNRQLARISERCNEILDYYSKLEASVKILSGMPRINAPNNFLGHAFIGGAIGALIGGGVGAHFGYAVTSAVFGGMAGFAGTSAAASIFSLLYFSQCAPPYLILS